MKIFLYFTIVAFYITIKFFFLLTHKDSKLYFWDVQQGDAILIDFKGKKILIDGGPNFEIDRYLSNFSILGECNLDILILTHFHADHIVGLNRILRHCRVKMLFYPESYVDQDSEQNTLWLNSLLNVSSQKIDKNISFNIKGLVITMIPTNFKSGNLNNCSFLVHLNYLNFDALLMADLERESIEKIKNGILENVKDNKIEIYKVSHHGSVNGHSVQFLSKIRPKICIISVGKKNNFGHPDPNVVNDLRKLGCEVRQTSLEGTIEVSFN